MDYLEAQSLLKLKGISVSKSILAGKDGDVTNGLYSDPPPLLSDKRMAAIKEVLGDGWNVYFLPNLAEIHIKKKYE
jgi:hypothetical protein